MFTTFLGHNAVFLTESRKAKIQSLLYLEKKKNLQTFLHQDELFTIINLSKKKFRIKLTRSHNQ